jgi:hypothetical protein
MYLVFVEGQGLASDSSSSSNWVLGGPSNLLQVQQKWFIRDGLVPMGLPRVLVSNSLLLAIFVRDSLESQICLVASKAGILIDDLFYLVKSRILC